MSEPPIDDFPRWPNYSNEEAEIAKRVLLSNNVNYWTGNEARSFEDEFAEYFHSEYAIALANGTVALELALKALNISSGDEVVVTSRSFIASASVVVNCGAKPVFADVDRNSQNITAQTIEAVLTRNTKAVICVHLAGWPCEMDEILPLCKQHDIHIIEDCAQAHGSKYMGKRVGSFGEIAAWSFCQDKIMTTAGEGGMITTSDKSAYEMMWSYKDHGKSLKKMQEKPTSTAFRWVHDSIGTNWRITEMQAAIGRYQLTKLDRWVGARRQNAATLNNLLGDIGGIRITQPDDRYVHAYYKYYFFTDTKYLAAGWSRDRIVAEIHSRGVPCFTGTCPEIYRETAFASPTQPILPVAHELGNTSIMLNVHPGLTSEHCEKTGRVVKNVMSRALR